MSATAEIILERESSALLIPLRASFLDRGKPAVYVQRGEKFELRTIEVGKRNEDDVIVLNGLSEGEVVALEDPIVAARRARKL